MFCWFPFVSGTFTVKMEGNLKAIMTTAEFMFERLPKYGTTIAVLLPKQFCAYVVRDLNETTRIGLSSPV